MLERVATSKVRDGGGRDGAMAAARGAALLHAAPAPVLLGCIKVFIRTLKDER